MTERGRENLRDVLTVIAMVISLVSAGGVMLAQSNASAQWVQKTDLRLDAIEKRNLKSDEENEQWRKLIGEALTRANFLCVNDPDCDRYFGRLKATE